MKVVIARDAPQKIHKLMAAQFPGQWDIVTVAADELIHSIDDADVIIPEGAAVDEGLLRQAKNLKLIQTGAGYDNIDIDACTQRGIWVTNAAGVNARAVAEQVLAFILCWCKNTVLLDNALKRDAFHMDYQGAELSEKVIGIVGLGNIGRQVARLAAAFDMRVLGYHYRPIRHQNHITMVDLPTLLKQSDIITLHVASNRQTRHMFAGQEFKLMKKDAFFINTCRGAVVDEAALIEALKQNRIGGAGLDVFAAEPLPADSPLPKLDNVILSPHCAGEPDGLFFHKNRFQFFAANIKRAMAGMPPQNALNEPTENNLKWNG